MIQTTRGQSGEGGKRADRAWRGRLLPPRTESHRVTVDIMLNIEFCLALASLRDHQVLTGRDVERVI